QVCEMILGLFDRAAAEREIFRCPEAADAERAFACGEAAVVAAEEAAARIEPLADPPPRGQHPRRIRGAVAVPGQEQKACVHVAAGERARVRLQLLAPAQRLDLFAHGVARFAELLD